MVTINDFETWLEEICDNSKYIKELNGKSVMYIIFTETYKYNIVVAEHTKNILGDGKVLSYLGCQVSSRKPRAGETWTRGNDLPDGPLTRETWEKIKTSILKYELVKIECSNPISEIHPSLGAD